MIFRIATDEEIRVLDDYLLYYSGDRKNAIDLREELRKHGFEIIATEPNEK
jgi:hypothetical protein